ncbi:hypothetical protein AB0N77_22060 [Streptomyces misionensis]|uniref:hypothetical protein n=1 Tax=Streptomyces misionensis TaxID=67331 RepID=UPI003413045D
MSGRAAAASAAGEAEDRAGQQRAGEGRRAAEADLGEVDVEDQVPGRERGHLDVAAQQNRQRPAYGAGPPERAAPGGAVDGRYQLPQQAATSWPGRRSALCRAGTVAMTPGAGAPDATGGGRRRSGSSAAARAPAGPAARIRYPLPLRATVPNRSPRAP